MSLKMDKIKQNISKSKGNSSTNALKDEFFPKAKVEEPIEKIVVEENSQYNNSVVDSIPEPEMETQIHVDEVNYVENPVDDSYVDTEEEIYQESEHIQDNYSDVNNYSDEPTYEEPANNYINESAYQERMYQQQPIEEPTIPNVKRVFENVIIPKEEPAVRRKSARPAYTEPSQAFSQVYTESNIPAAPPRQTTTGPVVKSVIHVQPEHVEKPVLEIHDETGRLSKIIECAEDMYQVDTIPLRITSVHDSVVSLAEHDIFYIAGDAIASSRYRTINENAYQKLCAEIDNYLRVGEQFEMTLVREYSAGQLKFRTLCLNTKSLNRLFGRYIEYHPVIEDVLEKGTVVDVKITIG